MQSKRCLNNFCNTINFRYIPQEGDLVLGIVSGKQGDIFKIDIGSADLASVSFSLFKTWFLDQFSEF